MKLLTMPADAYHADPCSTPSLSQSMARTLLTRSPLHAWRGHPKLGGFKREATKSMDNGTVIHDLLLNGGTLEGIDVVYHDNYRPSAAKADRDAIQAAGRIPVLQADYEELAGAAEKLKERLDDLGISLDGQKEGVATWEERSRDGIVVKCRARMDVWCAGTITVTDLKTTVCAHPDSIGKAVSTYGYDIQRAAYTRAIKKKFGVDAKFRHIFCELTEPYLLSVVELDDAYIALGEAKWQRAVDLWAKCLSTNNWPGYPENTTAFARPWDIRNELDHHSDVETLSRLSSFISMEISPS